MKRLVLFVGILFFTSTCYAQTLPATPPDTLESGWNVAVNGSFSSATNQGTNNGFAATMALRVAQHWNIRADTYLLTSPSVTVTLAKLEYRVSLAHMVKQSSFMVNANRMELFFNGGAGTARSSAVVNGVQRETRRPAYSVGAGFDISVSPTVTLRPLDVSYVRSTMLTNGGTFLGDHLQFEAGLGLRF
jgi:hypothetical protein